MVLQETKERWVKFSLERFGLREMRENEVLKMGFAV
jgi:hypothetical protein